MLDVFSGDLACEPFSWKYANGTIPVLSASIYNPSNVIVVDLVSESYTVNNLSIQWDPKYDPPQYLGLFDIASQWNISTMRYDELAIISLLLPGAPDENDNFELEDISGLTCRIDYTLTKRLVTNDTRAGGGIQISEDIQDVLELGVPSANITDAMSLSGETADADSLLGISNPYLSNSSVWFTLLNQSEPQESMAGFKDPEKLANISRQVFKRLAAQTANTAFTSPTTGNGTLPVLVTRYVNRLYVQSLALRLVEGFLASLAIVSLALIPLRRSAIPRDPGPLLNIAIALGRSRPVEKLLLGASALPEPQLHERLSRHAFVSSPGEVGEDSFHILATPLKESAMKPQQAKLEEAENLSEKDWWRPLGAKRWYQTFIAVLLLLIIIALEILYQYSAHHRGISNLPDGVDGYIKYTWTLIPSLLMTILGLSVSVLDSTARILSPFQRLAGKKDSSDALLVDPSAGVTAFNIPSALTGRHWSLAALMMTTILSPLLPVLTAGLYTPSAVVSNSTVPLSLNGWFDIQPQEVTSNGYPKGSTWDYASIVELMQFGNLTYPPWTFEQIALAPVALQTNPAPSSGSNDIDLVFRLDATVPAARGRFNCSLYQYIDDLSLEKDWSDNGGGLINLQIPKPSQCPRQNSTMSLSPDEISALTFSTGYFGAQMLPQDSSGSMMNDSCGDGLTHTWLALGHLEDKVIDELSLLHCVPYVEALQANVTLTWPNMSLDTSSVNLEEPPCRAIEDSARFLSNVASATVAPRTFVGDGLLQSGLAGTNASMGDFFATIAMGARGVPLRELSGRDNVPRLIEEVEFLYGQQMAQVLGADHRSSTDGVPVVLSSSSASDNVSALLDVPSGYLSRTDQVRLQQSAISTRLLEGVLALIFVLSVVAAVLSPPTDILPRDPNSLAAKFTLFAGSGLLSRLSESPEAFRKIGGTEHGGEDMTLGWHQRGQNREFGIDFTT